MSEEASNRKFNAKRLNEHTKLLANLFNALSVATFGAAFLVPISQRQMGLIAEGAWTLFPVALILHLGGQAAIRLMRSED